MKEDKTYILACIILAIIAITCLVFIALRMKGIV